MLTLGILAGGRSTRMGRDKAFIPVAGEPLITRVIRRLSPLADEVVLVGPCTPPYQALGFPVYEDLLPGKGPLGGLYTALSHAAFPLVLIAGCDMPFASPELFTLERDLLVAESMDVVLPASEKGLEPLHAIYRRDSCLPRIEAAIHAGESRLISWFPEVKVKVLAKEDAGTVDQYDQAFFNVNTEADRLQAESWAAQGTGVQQN